MDMKIKHKDIENLDDNKLCVSGGKMKGDINMNLYAIRKNPDPTFDDRLVRKKYTDDKFLEKTSLRKQIPNIIIWNFFKKEKFSVFKVDSEIDINDLEYDTTTRKVRKLFNHIIKNRDAYQTTSNRKPTLSFKSKRMNFRNF